MSSFSTTARPLWRSAIPFSAFVVFLVLAGTASANPPTDMTVSYGQLTSDLSVTITHPVGGIRGHYISEVTVTVNGNVVSHTFYTSQPGDTFTYTYPLSLKPGDIVVATATCSITGTASRTFIMPGATATAPETQKSANPAIAAPAGFAAAAAIRRRI